MRIISAREFRGKQKDYLDLAEEERVIIHREKNKKSVLLTPINKAGRVTSIRNLKNIWADIL